MTLDQILKEKREDIFEIATKHGASHVRVFGSVARGDVEADSDIDFLVEMEPGRSLWDMGGLLIDLQELLGCEVDVVSDRSLKAHIRERVINEAVPL